MDLKTMKRKIREMHDLFKTTRFYDESYTESIETIFKRIDELEEENRDLREDIYVYHQLRRIQDKREYRSKFLKEFQAVEGKNVMPDYDEIYKRYDKQKRIIEKLEKELKGESKCSDD